MKKLMIVCLIVVMCLGNTFMVNAEERGVLPSGEIIEVKEVSGGQWYAVIKGSDGYSYTTSNYSGGATITTSNLQKGVTYEVTMYWVIGTNAVRGYYTMDTSY